MKILSKIKKLHPKMRKSAFLSADGQMRVELNQDCEVRIIGSEYYVPCKILSKKFH